MRTVKIGALNIRFRNISATEAQGAANGLGGEIVNHLQHVAGRCAGQSRRTDTIDAGSMHISSSNGTQRLARAIAEQIANHLISKTS